MPSRCELPTFTCKPLIVHVLHVALRWSIYANEWLQLADIRHQNYVGSYSVQFFLHFPGDVATKGTQNKSVLGFEEHRGVSRCAPQQVKPINHEIVIHKSLLICMHSIP